MNRSRHPLVENFAQAYVVEFFQDPVEAALLNRPAAGRRQRRLRFEGSVNAFVASVLLLLAGLDELWKDPQSNPPGGERRKTRQSISGKGDAVVGVDPCRKALLLKQACEDDFGAGNSDGLESLAVE